MPDPRDPHPRPRPQPHALPAWHAARYQRLAEPSRFDRLVGRLAGRLRRRRHRRPRAK
ncbi:hypothetical protein [Actinomadura parmotrematis]|uniref:Uncharacterized protein n=1 Tax=Actinomadura parmotrematis TaxID=2864039 RepID=A0ABS7FYW2_9ACTN|nr:hypothetical protein [Actinomadura parmotrematis]MBW8484839.1 hypothetical protein [Actinomadura parmotrematis]